MNEHNYDLTPETCPCAQCGRNHQLMVMTRGDVGAFRFTDFTSCGDYEIGRTRWLPVEWFQQEYPTTWDKIQSWAGSDADDLRQELSLMVEAFGDPSTAQATRQKVYEELDPGGFVAAELLARTTGKIYRSRFSSYVTDHRDPETGRTFLNSVNMFVAGIAQGVYEGREGHIETTLSRQLRGVREGEGIVLYEDPSHVASYNPAVAIRQAVFPDTDSAIDWVQEIFSQHMDNVEDLDFSR